MDLFLNDFLRNLPNIDPDVFKNHVSSMMKVKQHEDLNIAEEVDRNWKEVTDETYSFERLNNE
ncbi:nardilysin-like, partial [Paramuricea clavata]